MASDRWDMSNWTKTSPVKLSDAFGVTKGTIKYPAIKATLPAAQSQAKTAQNTPASDSAVPSGQAAVTNYNDAVQLAAAQPYNWTGSQMVALNNIVMAESGWDATAENPSSGAYGIPQALPGSKMASAGQDWKTDPKTQIKWMLEYIRSRYGTPQAAWQFHEANGWY
jgi:hypothetical protein